MDVTRRGRIDRLQTVEKCAQWALRLARRLAGSNLKTRVRDVLVIHNRRVLGAPLLETDVLQGLDDELRKIRRASRE